MIEFEFDGALQASSGVAEALHAAGTDVCVPAWAEMVEAEPSGVDPAEWKTD